MFTIAMLALAGCSVANSGDDQTSEQTAAVGRADVPGGAIPVTVKAGVHDPGPRGGNPGAGKPIRGLNNAQKATFNEGRFRVREFLATCEGCNTVTEGTEIPPGASDDTNASGAGARFTGVSCAVGCHSQPDIGGSAGPTNQSFFAAHFRGAVNTVPAFESPNGPPHEARFQFNPDGTRDGSVQPLFTVKGRTDAPDCVDIAQPDFAGNQDNLALRIPTPLFGLGLIEAINDSEILARHEATAVERGRLGIGGVSNRGPLGTISRFGWKAQTATVGEQASRQSATEIGVSTDLSPIRITDSDQCNLHSQPADTIHVDATEARQALAKWQRDAEFIRLLDQPAPATLGASALRGQALFTEIGCATCHTPTMHTRAGEQGSSTIQLRDVNVNLYSDLLVHSMGGRLADNIIEGNAGPDMFRSAPLWGIGQRLFFLHDGRAKTLDDAILQHYSAATPASGRNPAYAPSEANQVILNFGDLDAQSQQDLLNFLRRL